jgi:hypothetical protein
LKSVYVRYPSLIEPLQHLIEAETHLATYPEFSKARFDEANADLAGLTAQLELLSNGNPDLRPTPFRTVNPVPQIRYWGGITAQVKTLIEEEQWERAELLTELAWTALHNLARRGSWSPDGKHPEQYLADAASQSLAIAVMHHKSEPNHLAVAMRRIIDAVALSLARNRPVDPSIRAMYDVLAPHAGQPEPAVYDPVPNATLALTPSLYLDGSCWSRFL